MVKVKTYNLPPTKLMPNSPHPLLHYPNLLPKEAGYKPSDIHALLASNGWQTQWIFRYGPTQESHYHSSAHETMIVLSGTATIRFGVADTIIPNSLEEEEENSDDKGGNKEIGGIEIQAYPGDVFILPAGMAHKTFDPVPEGDFRLLSPGEGNGIVGIVGGGEGDVGEMLNGILLEPGFTMMGAYPWGSEWDFETGREDHGLFDEKIWLVSKPARDPVLGDAPEGLCGQWEDVEVLKAKL